jgi:uncharacterized protein
MTRRWFSLLSLALILALALPVGSAAAQSLDDLRASGKLGESYTGYVVARDPAVAGQAKTINDKRRAIYEQQAAKQGVSLEAISAVYAGEILGQVPAGTWVLTADGKWRQK